MKIEVYFEVPGLPPTPNGSNGHPQTVAANRKKWRRMTYAAALPAVRPERPLVDVELTITRYSSCPSDFDNRVAAAKPIVDGLKDAGIILDDSDKFIVRRDYPQGSAPQGGGYVSVLVVGSVISEEAYNAWVQHQTQLAAKKLKRRLAQVNRKGIRYV